VLTAAAVSGLLDRRGALVLLSGGRDSVCLLDVTVRLLGADLTRALHVNHGLRDDAGADERHCVELCARLGVALDVARPPAPARGNVQAWAREVRYDAARERADRSGAAIAVGHTATDQAETILYRLAAAPGRRALLGMPARDGRLVRPLLALTREETAAYCRARGLEWREDASNASDAYARNRARAGLVPALRELHPAAEANVVRTAELLRDEAAVLDELVADVLGGADRIELERLGALRPALARLVVRRMAEDVSGALNPRAGGRVDELLALAPRGGSAALELGDGVRAVVEYGVLRMEPVATAAATEPAPVVLPIPGRARFGAWELACAGGPPEPADGVLDADALASELTVRGWRPGDRMTPIGLGGSKTLQDLFTDRRVPRAQRRELPVVESAGEIAWVPGLATGARFRVTGDTARAVRLTARRTGAGAPPAPRSP